jgi:hypothetical protein
VTDLIPSNWSIFCEKNLGKVWHLSPRRFWHEESRFSEQQMALILKQAEDGTTVEEVCRKAGISIQT